MGKKYMAENKLGFNITVVPFFARQLYMELFIYGCWFLFFFSADGKWKLTKHQLGIQALPHGKSCKNERCFKSLETLQNDTGRNEDLKMKAVV